MRPSVSMLQRLMVGVHETWESIREPVLSGLRAEAGIPAATRSVTVSLDGIMVPLQPRARSHPDAAWREACCDTVGFYDSVGNQLKMELLAKLPVGSAVLQKAPIERRSGPLKLVCTKNRASYEYRMVEYVDDIVLMNEIVDNTPGKDSLRDDLPSAIARSETGG